MSRYILLVILISLINSGCYTSLEKRYHHVEDKDKIIGQWYTERGEISKTNGVTSVYKITYYLTFYRDGNYGFGIDSPFSEPNGKYKCNTDTLNINTKNHSDLYLMKVFENEDDLDLKLLSAVDSLSNKVGARINYEGLWRRR